jgi:transcriptional regulator with XRE-family HTH domain
LNYAACSICVLYKTLRGLENLASNAFLFTYYTPFGLLHLLQKSINKLIFDNMTHSTLANYLRYHRKRSGLSQREIAQLLGYPDQDPVSRHERSRSIPPLIIALCYQAIFRVPVSDLVPGHFEKTRRTIEERLAKMEHDLQQRSAKDRDAAMVARKFEWMWERNNPQQSD